MTDKENLGSCLAVNLKMLSDMIDRDVKPLISSGKGSDNPDNYLSLQATLKLCNSQMEQLQEAKAND